MFDFLKASGNHHNMRRAGASDFNRVGAAVIALAFAWLPRGWAEPGSEASAPSQVSEGEASPVPKPDTSQVWLAHVIREKSETARIHGLEVTDTRIPVTMSYQGQRLRPLVQIPLRYDKPGWSLLVQGQFPVPKMDDAGAYKIFAYLNGRVNEVSLTALGPEKQSETERLYVVAPEAQEFKIVAPWDAFQLGIGSSLFLYKQTGYNDYRAWTGLVAFKGHTPEEGARFGLLGEAEMTVLTASSNQVYAPQMGHGLLDGIYFFRWSPNSRWRAQALVGLEYLTMFANGAPFGFGDLMAPEAGVRARYILNGTSDLVMDFRYAPMSGSLSTEQHGLVCGLSRSWILGNLHRVEAGLRYLDFRYDSDPAATVSINMLSFLFSYSL